MAETSPDDVRPSPEKEERPLPDPAGEDSERPDEDGATVEEQSEDSFPASDAPAW
ncbi:MAG: hypothetical protein ABR505_09715 [Actinomycetota bacterium]